MSSPDNNLPDPAPRPSDLQPLAGYEVVVGVTGGIAAYKTAVLVSQLVQDGCGVTVAMTRNARRFVGPVTFRALTHRPIYGSMWKTSGGADIQHLALSERADLVVVAPASANILGKLANGLADDLLSTLLLGADCPVLMAPAMNTRMWKRPAVQRNIKQLSADGVVLVGPDEGRLACGTTGPGRMSEPEALRTAIHAQLLAQPPRRRE